MDLTDTNSNQEIGGNIKLLNDEDTSIESKSNQKQSVSVDDFKNKKTLDEPIIDTIMRDLTMIGYKLKYVLQPKMREERGKELRKWDLWGPLLLCVMLALTLTMQNETSESDTIFATIFVVIWIGAGVVTLNAKLLRGKISFFQSVCVLGYCIFPINLASLLISLFGMFFKVQFFIKVIFLSLGCSWSTISSVGFMATLVSEKKKILAVYPVLLFYLFLSLLCLIA